MKKKKTRLEQKRLRFKRRVDHSLKKRDELVTIRLCEGRKSAGLTQLEVARKFGRDQSFISRIETGLQSATFVEVERLACIYGMKFLEFWDVSRLALK